jgi:hypothetical protein
MKQLILLAVALMMLQFHARAEVFECTFSEPALNLRYDSEAERVTMKKDLLGQPEITSDVSFHILSSGIFVLKGEDGKQIAKLTLNNNGSDGATETLYPFEIVVSSLSQQSNRGVGGCSSSLLKSVKN